MTWRRWFWVGYGALAALLLVQAVTLPENGIPAQSGFGGTVERWGTKTEYLVSFLVLMVVFAVLFGTTRWWIRRLPATLINVPHPEYWLQPERRDELADRLGDVLAKLGLATLLFIGALAAETPYTVRTGHGLGFDWVYLLVFLAVTTWIIIWILTGGVFDPPTESAPPRRSGRPRRSPRG